MNLYNIPGVDGYKTLLGSWGTFLVGFAGTLTTLATAVAALGSLLSGTTDLSVFGQQIEPFLLSLGAMFGGLMGLGIGHKIEKATK